MKTLLKREKGDFAVEAVLGLTIFMIAVLSIMLMSMLVRVQATMQYALGQTAKEISGYYYLLDKLGLASLTSGASAEDVSEVNQTIGRVINFADESSSKVSDIDFSEGIDFETIADISDPEEMLDQAKEICDDIDALAEDPKGQLQAVLTVFGKSMVNKGISYYVAPFVCKAIMPKYLSEDRDAVEEYLKSVGIEDGIKGLDFSQSQLLTDGRSIKLVVMYKVNTKSITFGLVDKDIYFEQTATTAAWIRPDGESKKYLTDLVEP